MAQDKRQDWAPGTVDYWKAKLKTYADQEICQALMCYRGELFPSVDDIIRLIETVRSDKANSQDGPRPAFIPCGQNGCICGYRPLGPDRFDRWQKCQCLLDYATQVKATGRYELSDGARERLRSEAELAQEWAKFKRNHGLPEDMTVQQYWVEQNRELIRELASRMDMNAAKPHPKAAELLKLRKQGITGKAAYKLLDTSPSGRSYREHFGES